MVFLWLEGPFSNIPQASLCDLEILLDRDQEKAPRLKSDCVAIEYPPVMTNVAIEMAHWNSEISH